MSGGIGVPGAEKSQAVLYAAVYAFGMVAAWVAGFVVGFFIHG